MHNFDDVPYWEHETGRWMCNSVIDAQSTVEEHPGDTVYIYDRDRNGKQTNIHQYWSPQMPDTRKQRIVKGGKIR